MTQEKVKVVLLNPKLYFVKVIHYISRKFRFKEYHFNDRLISMEMVRNPQFIVLKKSVSIGYYCRIECVCQYHGEVFTPTLIFERGVDIQQNLHLTCANKIIIGENTKIAAGVTITDIIHPYDDINLPFSEEKLEVKETIIGKRCLIYNGAVILPGVHIGDSCVIGANAVVTHDIPAYCVVAGVPAKIIKQYDFKSKKWNNK